MGPNTGQNFILTLQLWQNFEKNTERNKKLRSKKFEMGPKNRGQNIVLVSLLGRKLEKHEVIILF